MKIVIGCIQIVFGLILWGVAISVGISWIAFCFGTVVIGILLLIFAPYVLLAPPAFIATPANAMLITGWLNIKS